MTPTFADFTSTDAVLTFNQATGAKIPSTVAGQLLYRKGAKKLQPETVPATYSSEHWAMLWKALTVYANAYVDRRSTEAAIDHPCPITIMRAPRAETRSGPRDDQMSEEDWDLDVHLAEVGLRGLVRRSESAWCATAWVEAGPRNNSDQFWVDLDTAHGSTRLVLVGEMEFRSLHDALEKALAAIHAGKKKAYVRSDFGTVGIERLEAAQGDEPVSFYIRDLQPGSWTIAGNATYTVKGQFEDWLPRMHATLDGLNLLLETLAAAISDIADIDGEFRSSVFLAEMTGIMPATESAPSISTILESTRLATANVRSTHRAQILARISSLQHDLFDAVSKKATYYSSRRSISAS